MSVPSAAAHVGAPNGPPSVGALHQELIEAGAEIEASEVDGELYGPSTITAVEAFQRAAGLRVDGIAGPMTWGKLRADQGQPGDRFTAPGWRSDIDGARPQVRDVVRAAVAELGAVEVPPGSNRGPRVDVYSAPQVGTPWCAWFCSYVYRRSHPPSPFGRLGAVWAIWRWGRDHRRLVEVPEPGDLALVRRPGGRGHVGIVVAVLDDGRICTVEGNARQAVRGLVRSRAALPDLVRPVP